MARKKKSEETTAIQEQEESGYERQVYLDDEVHNYFSTYTPELHGELTDDDVEAIAIKISGIFNYYDVYEIEIQELALTSKLEVLLNFLGLLVTQVNSTAFNVSRKEYYKMLTAYSTFKESQ